MDNIFIFALALAFDLVLGDPPTRFHPVGWMGKMISFAVAFLPSSNRIFEFIYGSFIVILGIAIWVVPLYFLLDFFHDTYRIAYIIVGALLLKSVFSVRGLSQAALDVKRELESCNIQGARTCMPSLVSRNTGELDSSEMAAATIESVAESASDSYVAPIFWFLILGIPGAVGYRVVNTFDSMIGYRGRYEYLGKFAARTDDILNLVPARLSGIMISVAALLSRNNFVSSWRTMMRDHSKTESPNAGWPMSAAAGALDVQLEKSGHYILGNKGNNLSAETIKTMLVLMWLVVGIWSLICLGIEGVIFVLSS